MDEEQKVEKRRRSPLKMGGYASVAVLLAIAVAFKNCQNQKSFEAQVQQYTKASVDAINRHVAESAIQQVESQLGVVSNEPEQVQQEDNPGAVIAPIEAARNERDAYIHRLMELSAADGAAAQCERGSHFIELAHQYAQERGISAEDWLIRQLALTLDQRQEFVLHNGLNGSAEGIAESRSKMLEPHAIAQALDALYDGRDLRCSRELSETQVIANEVIDAALTVKQIRVNQVMESVPDEVPMVSPDWRIVNND